MTKSKDEKIHIDINSKIREISKNKNQTNNLIFSKLSLERFLARLEQSPYKDNLIFKGGLCLSNFIDIGRETKDIDFLVKNMEATKNKLEKVFEEISSIDLNDGFKFTKIKIEDLKNQKKYSGFRVDINFTFGKSTKNKVQIDLGIDDIVDSEKMNFKTLRTSKESLFYPENLQIQAYTPEFIFSEKLQATINLGASNSRMKDYHDMFMMISSELLDIEKLKDSISKTFEHRQTVKSLIPTFDTQEWERHRNQLTEEIKNKLPENFSDVCENINTYLSENKLV